MKIAIGENIKRLRRDRDLTQEELADAVGVSTQSVSRWERGDCYPDLELIPVLARYFEVTTDELLGTAALSDLEQYNEVHMKMVELQSRGVPREENNYEFDEAEYKRGHAEASEFIRETARDFPNNWRIQMRLANDYTEGPEPNSAKAVGIYERVIEKCRDDNLRWQAIEQLAWHHRRNKNPDLAIATAKRLPEANHAQENLLEQFYAGQEEGPQFSQSQVKRHAERLHGSVECLIRAECAAGLGSAREHLAKWRFSRETERIFADWAIWGAEGDVNLGNVFLEGAEYLAERGELDSALDYVEVAADAYREILDLYEKRDGHRGSAETYIGRIENRSNKKLDPLRDHPRFLAAAESLR